jgi:hypothetical protein
MPPPYPVLLFTGQRIIDEARQITGKVVDRISHATLASLTAKPVDDIVQALYNEHYIHLPVLDRNGAEHEEFEFFYPSRHIRAQSLRAPYAASRRRQGRFRASGVLHRHRVQPESRGSEAGSGTTPKTRP